MATATSPDVSGIKVSVATVTTNGTPSTTIVPIGHLDSLGALKDKSRNVQRYTPLNNTQFDEIVGMGPLSNAGFSMSVLYDPEGTEGINIIETAIDNNSQVQIIIELGNAKTGPGKGTTYKQITKVSKLTVNGEKDGKFKAEFSAEKIGSPVITPAS